MAHTKTYKLKHQPGGFLTTQETVEVTVIVNSDWSGYAEVTWEDREGHHGPVNLPGAVLLAIAKGESKELLKEAASRLIDEL